MLLLAGACALLMAACSPEITYIPEQTNENAARSGLALSGNYLFLVNQHHLQGYDISRNDTLVKVGSMALHHATDTLYALPGNQLIVGLQGNSGFQRFSALAQPGLLGAYKSWRQGTQLATYGQNIAVLFSRDSFSLLLYNAANTGTGADPGMTAPLDTVLSSYGPYMGLAAKDNIVYAVTVGRVMVLSIGNDHYTLLQELIPLAASEERLEDASLAGNELVLRSDKQFYFYDITQPQAPALLAKLPR
ncbi:hypothetical protein DCC81_19610 [Chitinophaga parva]|uniref:Uncharacterized protein n=2 Tax=Chitinophaga parva TaxID=2169414 RepID=A0A2T7BC28_9BACT|nr:hypothetical protein DCC81_19610 [Chitinophaga parva]